MMQKILWTLLQTKIFHLEARKDERYLQVTRAVYPVPRVCVSTASQFPVGDAAFYTPGGPIAALQSASRRQSPLWPLFFIFFIYSSYLSFMSASRVWFDKQLKPRGP